jgi:thiamine biosynthesis protein ThiS
MRIVINGFEEDMEPGSTIADAIARWEEHDLNLVVELNHRFVPPASFALIALKDGDQVEFINPAFGG